MENLNRTDHQTRLVIIDQMLRKKQHPTLADIQRALQSKGLKSGRRTIQRDIAVLEGKVDVDIESRPTDPGSEGGAKGWYYYYASTPGDLGDVMIDRSDLQAVALAREMLRHTVGTPAGDSLKQTYDKLLGLADEKIRLASAAGVPIAFAGSMNSPVDPDVWNAVLQAIRDRKTIRMTYVKSWNKTVKPDRVIDPYYIVNLAGEWYLIGTAQLTDSCIRQYRMSSIRKVVDTRSTFKMPADFDIDKYLENVFGRFIGDPRNLVTIRVKFNKRVTALVRDQRFHRRELKQIQKNGDIVVEFPVTPAGPWPFYHVISWILSWGADAKVLAPAKLKKLVAKECVKMAGNR